MNKLILSALLLATFSGCTAAVSMVARRDHADRIAAAAGMTRTRIPAGMFDLTAWKKISQPGKPVRVYIEGDGLAWMSRYEPSRNPTPPEPMGLKLAAEDDFSNVVALARPCQYSGLADGTPCTDSVYWTSGRTAPEVVDSFNAALDRLKRETGAGAFELVGYSGGAAVAALVAAGRNDIASLRTVAGNLHYAAFARVHDNGIPQRSVRPESVAARLSRLPQRHFVGAQDAVVPEAVLKAWREASGTSCIGSATVEATHDTGWAEAWPALLRDTPTCY